MTISKHFNSKVLLGIALVGGFILGAESNETKYKYSEVTDIEGTTTATLSIPQPTFYQKMVKDPIFNLKNEIEDQFSREKPSKPAEVEPPFEFDF